MSDGLSLLTARLLPAIPDDATSSDDWTLDLIPVWVGSSAPEDVSLSTTASESVTIKEAHVRGKEGAAVADVQSLRGQPAEMTFVAAAPIGVSSGSRHFAEDYWANVAGQHVDPAWSIGKRGRYIVGSYPMQAVVGVGGVGSDFAFGYPRHPAGGGSLRGGVHGSGHYMIATYHLADRRGGERTWMHADPAFSARRRFLSFDEVDEGHRSVRLKVLADEASDDDETDEVADAATRYLEAFGKVLDIAPQASTSVTEIEGETVWRLTLTIPSKYLDDIEQLIELESKAHAIVQEKSPEFAGFFSIQYVASNGDAPANL